MLTVTSGFFYSHRCTHNDHDNDHSCSIKVHGCRKKGNHHLLLFIHGPNDNFTHPRFRCRSPCLCRLSLLCRRPVWSFNRNMLVSPRNRVCRLPVRRGWHPAVFMGIVSLSFSFPVLHTNLVTTIVFPRCLFD